MTGDAPLRIARLPQGAVSYREAGSGPAILFLHGLNGGSRSWIAQREGLAARHRVIAWDTPGYGRSDPIEPDADRYADAAAGLLAALDAGPAAVVGHSMGGVVAGRLAHRHPDRIARLVLSCTHWGLARARGAPFPDNYASRVEERRRLGPGEYGLARARNMLPADASPEVVAAVASISDEVSAEGLERAIRMELDADNRPLLAALEMPILLIDADRDPVLKPDRAAALAALLPTARRVTLAGLGHAPYLEDPARFNAALEDFMRNGDR